MLFGKTTPDRISPRTDDEISASKQRAFTFLIVPSVLFFLAGTLVFIGSQGGKLDLLGITVNSLTGIGLVGVAGLFLGFAYRALFLVEQISSVQLDDMKRTLGQPGLVNQYIEDMKQAGRSHVIREDLARLKRRYKIKRQGRQRAVTNQAHP